MNHHERSSRADRVNSPWRHATYRRAIILSGYTPRRRERYFFFSWLVATTTVQAPRGPSKVNMVLRSRRIERTKDTSSRRVSWPPDDSKVIPRVASYARYPYPYRRDRKGYSEKPRMQKEMARRLSFHFVSLAPADHAIVTGRDRRGWLISN